jgi:carbon-monoxide dehydrogenase medium subunit
MKPTAFTYHRPRALAEVLALLAEHGDAAKILAGGQSLGPMLNMRLAQPAHLIDINDLREFADIRDAGGTIAVGALARQHDVARSELVRGSCPLLAEATATIGHYAIRQRGTVGGSLAHADPAAQLPLIAITLGAAIDVVGPRGRRTMPAAEFFVSVMTTALEADELVAEVRFPKQAPGEGVAFELFSQRHGDFALAAVAATVAMAADGRVRSIRLGAGGVDAVPLVLTDAVRPLVGRAPDERWCDEVTDAATAHVNPEDTPRVPARFRQEVCAVLMRRALARAAARAGRN